MESFTEFFCTHAHYAHFVLFGIILLAGVNIPIPEDLLLMTGGILVSTCAPEHYWIMYFFLYIGAVLSAYIAYWLGRKLGPKLYDIRFFHHVITRERVHKIGHFLESYGTLTFITGRFIPFGMRNCIFMTCGLWKMPFTRFMARDAIAAFIATTVMYHLGIAFGENHEVLFYYFRSYEMIVIGVIATILLSVVVTIWYKKRKSRNDIPS